MKQKERETLPKPKTQFQKKIQNSKYSVNFHSIKTEINSRGTKININNINPKK